MLILALVNCNDFNKITKGMIGGILKRLLDNGNNCKLQH